jgi:6-pyruvoyltetrahydropterin/6-carboxytetrahydropterin synthase
VSLIVFLAEVFMFQSTKRYGHDRGFSCCYRQWRADSHCRFLHGYALAFNFVFEATQLDERGWVVDFGDLKSLENGLRNRFDHTILVALDDPEYLQIKSLGVNLGNVTSLEGVGCEAFAYQAWDLATNVLRSRLYTPRVRVVSAEVCEHAGNSAIYYGPKP